MGLKPAESKKEGVCVSVKAKSNGFSSKAEKRLPTKNNYF